MNISFLHPSDETLSEVALGDLGSVDAERTGLHIAGCARCGAKMHGLRAMRHVLLDARDAPANEAMLQCVLERRRSGERVLLPEPEGEPEVTVHRTTRTRYVSAAAVVAIAAAAVVAVVLWPRFTLRDTSRAAPRRSDVGEATVASPTAPREGIGAAPAESDGFSIWPAFAYAATPPQNAEAEYPAVSELDASVVQRGARMYVRSSASAYSDYKPFSAQSMRVSDTTWRGEAVWRVIADEALLSPWARIDTAWIRQRDFRLLARRYVGLGGRTLQRSLNDSVLEQTTIIVPPPEVVVTIERSRLTNTTRIPLRPGRILVTDPSSFMLLVRTLPLHATWRGSIDVNRAITPALHHPPRSLNLSVQGDSTVSTLWGHVPCWRVVLHTGPTPERWYVSKEGHEVLLVTGPAATNWPRSRLDLIGRYLK